MKMLNELRVILGSRYLVSVFLLTKISLSKQYKYSFLGMAWTLLLPTVQIGVYAFVFSTLFKLPQKGHAHYIMAGTLPWAFISGSIMTSCHALLNNAGAIKRCVISKTIFPVSEVLKSLYLFLVSFGALYIISLFLFVTPDWSILQLPIAILPMVIFTLSASIAVSFVTPYMRDINEFLNVFFMIGFYLTPILYQIELIPERLRGYFELNPMYILLKPVYAVVFEQRLLRLQELSAAFFVGIAVSLFSYWVYRKARERVIFYF